MFKDRQSAGRLLAKHLKEYKAKKNTLVLGIPRGGVVVAAQVARSLNLPLDIMVTRKIGAPFQPELALGAVDADKEVVWNLKEINDLGLKIKDLKKEAEKQVCEIKRREVLYRQGKTPLSVADKMILLVDDGIATGLTILSAAKYLKRHKVKKIILAAPVASQDAGLKLLEHMDESVILETPGDFQAVGQFYQSFEPVEDAEVIQLM
ncbi:hypothetical protein A3C26_01515 [Candidatus Daviesbacteria bacterium RIFCSPHIGHO2_02_FULL_39_12]|uniref:Phosphoribosyltransferase domain-containing protein n=2 Tax=Candidatus Daviesiibacteriota TaxID=1752718 RepID=A0A1F5JCY0_9BACT|nr:MAG: hypothetical protein A3C26_01515 [Candidatus Daviesbacteria bacterium RIFCSPHIGHO2_02_FULL_39_12]OGE72883.1 MAG: hypothetical protein A3H40_01755 [Candidatus Daviesbacteria bacterium RIFCSPLOWO2_02_FULL_38_15]